MITYNMVKYGRWLLGLYLMIFMMTSCTYDYFVDENNLRIYVPQIEKGEIERFYIAFHDKSGKHTLTRQIDAPFNKDELMQQGILRFKLPYGEYNISCFADYTPGSITEGNPFSDSYQKKDRIKEQSDTYRSRTTNPRSFFTDAMVYPIGHPEAAVPRTINIDENQRYKGKVITRFKKLPAVITRVDIYYKGLSTKYSFDGIFNRFSPNDRILASFDVASNTSGTLTEFHNIINPSAGTNFGVMPSISNAVKHALVGEEPMELDIRLFDTNNNLVGLIPFTMADFEDFKANNPTKVPVDSAGNPIENLILKPQDTILFTFEGFTVVSIQLYGWGDIIEGGGTPM